MEKRELTEQELYQVKIANEFKRLKSLPITEIALTAEQKQAELESAKQNNYENKIVAEIRKKYNINQELAILRQRDTKPEEFSEYNEYVESCKAKVKSEIGG